MDLFHCFGANLSHEVDTPLAVAMLRASGCRHLAINTQNILAVSRGEDLPVGYLSATFGSVMAAYGRAARLEPVLNINHAVTAAEAIARARRAVELTGVVRIKLEVLDSSLTETDNEQVLHAAERLRESGLEVWPLLNPVREDIETAMASGYPVVRVMGSPIGSLAGVGARAVDSVQALGPRPGKARLMLDGGLGKLDDLKVAASLGFDSVLVNSWLFSNDHGPARTLSEIRSALERL